MDLDYFKKINNAFMSSGRKETLTYETKDRIARNFYNSMDSYKVKIGEEEVGLTIIGTGNTDTKKIKAMPGEEFQYGDIVEWMDSHWLVTERDAKDDIICEGKMQECNYELQWQNETGDIVKRWIITQDASSYSNGTAGNKTIEVGADQLMLKVPLDEETVKLRRGKRFFVDNSGIEPLPYEIKRPDSTTYVKNGHGYLAFIVVESQTTDKDRPDLMLCDYFEPEEKPVKVNGGCAIECKYDTIKSGGATRSYTAKFYDYNGNEVADVVPKWTIVCDFMDSLKVTQGDVLEVAINDDDKIGEQFTIKLIDVDEVFAENEKTITVESLY